MPSVNMRELRKTRRMKGWLRAGNLLDAATNLPHHAFHFWKVDKIEVEGRARKRTATAILFHLPPEGRSTYAQRIRKSIKIVETLIE
jgi:hypothetical protein